MTTPDVLILTPMKDAAGFLEGYFANLKRLSYPGERLSLGMLESDSADDTFAEATALAGTLAGRFASVHLWKHDYGFRYPPVIPRWWPPIQKQRRSILARSRNRLLFRAMRGHHWVLWLDVDVVEYPADIVTRLLATGKRIVQPNCVTEYGGESFDKNAWRGRKKAFLSDLRNQGDIVTLDSVGGTMLLVDADLHRDGLVFPAFPYGQADRKRIPRDVLRMETEGLALMARDMGETCWGLPNLEIRHHPG